MDKPLFIPLKKEHYDAFASGIKTHEFRKHGARWNKKTCYVGRAVTLSRGYGKQSRINGVISSVDIITENQSPAFIEIYGSGHECIAIGIKQMINEGK